MQCLVARANDFTFFRETKKNCPLLLKESTHKGKAYRTEEFQMCEWQRKKGFIPIVNGSEDVGFLMPCMVTPSHKSINPFRMKTPNYLFFRGKKTLFYHQIGNTNFFIFITNQSNLMFCLDKIKYEHLAILSNLKSCQLASRIAIFNLSMCCQFEDSQIILPKIIPISHHNI